MAKTKKSSHDAPAPKGTSNSPLTKKRKTIDQKYICKKRDAPATEEQLTKLSTNKSKRNIVQHEVEEVDLRTRKLDYIGSTSSRCTIEYIKKIVGKFGPEIMEMIRATPIGYLLDIKIHLRTQYAPWLGHFLWQRHLGRMVFKIGQTTLKCTLKEWALVTGLICIPGEVPFYRSREESYLINLVPDKLTLPNLMKGIHSCENRENQLKLIVVLLFYSYFMGQHKSCLIPTKFFVLAEDLDKFFAYPWGNVTYDAICQGLEKALNPKRKWKGAYNIYGCTYALQAWFFERCHPNISSKFASREEGDKRPRLLNWFKLCAPQHSELLSIFQSPTKGKFMSELKPTEEEEATEYWAYVSGSKVIDESTLVGYGDVDAIIDDIVAATTNDMNIHNEGDTQTLNDKDDAPHPSSDAAVLSIDTTHPSTEALQVEVLELQKICTELRSALLEERKERIEEKKIYEKRLQLIEEDLKKMKDKENEQEKDEEKPEEEDHEDEENGESSTKKNNDGDHDDKDDVGGNIQEDVKEMNNDNDSLVEEEKPEEEDHEDGENGESRIKEEMDNDNNNPLVIEKDCTQKQKGDNEERENKENETMHSGDNKEADDTRANFIMVFDSPPAKQYNTRTHEELKPGPLIRTPYGLIPSSDDDSSVHVKKVYKKRLHRELYNLKPDVNRMDPELSLSPTFCKQLDENERKAIVEFINGQNIRSGIKIIDNIEISPSMIMDLYKKQQWTTDDHIDAFFALLTNYLEGEEFVKIGLAKTYTWSWMLSDADKFKKWVEGVDASDKEKANMYHKFWNNSLAKCLFIPDGPQPRFWERHTILIPAINHVKMHWFLLVLYVENHLIGVLDSLVDNPLVVYKEQLDKLCYILPYMLYSFGCESAMEGPKWRIGELSREFNVPRQKNGDDCGIFVMAMAYYLTHNVPFDFSQTDILGFRRRFCYQLMNGRL